MRARFSNPSSPKFLNLPRHLFSIDLSIDLSCHCSLSQASPFLDPLLHAYHHLIYRSYNSQPQPQSQAYDSYQFPNTTKFSACNDLPVLDSFLHWTYHSSSNSIFKKNKASYKSWIARAINPISTGMVGSQAFVAFQKYDGTMAAYTSPITSYGTTLEKGRLSFEVLGVSTSFEDVTMILYASFQLPGNSKLVNHVWQEGPVSDDDVLRSHTFSGANLKSVGHIDLCSRIKLVDSLHFHAFSGANLNLCIKLVDT
ncbi:hypothetical protein K1719_038845 [Acacia pycnantha]|nr:hypothetical protein K1719_038845 [Acacia pycnantha]